MIQKARVLYRIDDKKKEKELLLLCRKLGFQTRALKISDAGKEIGVLAGINRINGKSHEKVPESYQMPEILIFSGVPNTELDRFLAEYKKAGIEQVGLKAIVTPHNLLWTVCELTAEIVRERTAILMGGGRTQR
jgi:hypothetical protein